MQDINFLKDGNLTVSAKTTIFNISYYKTDNYFINLEAYINYVKACQSLVRTNDRYTEYKANLYALGLDRCQVLGNISTQGTKDSIKTSKNDITIEMHHGPILTLFDYCAIVIDYNLAHKIPVSTFGVANTVLDEHFAGRVQTVMLSKTAHQAVEAGKAFINLNQAVGDLNAFLKKYKDGVNKDYIYKINKYIDLCAQYDSTDNNLFELRNTISSWDYNEAIDREALKNK